VYKIADHCPYFLADEPIVSVLVPAYLQAELNKAWETLPDAGF